MQTCPECGTRNAAGAQFCSNCGAFLAWEDEQSPARTGSSAPRPMPEPGPPPPRPRPEPRPEPPPATGRGPTQHNPRKVRRLPADPVEQAPVEQDDRTVVLPRTPDTVPGPEHRSGSPSPPDGTERAGSSSTVRGPDSVPPSREPPPVPPGDTPGPPPRPRDQETDAPAPGEVVCPRCGTGNTPDRHFCRRCAMELDRGAPSPAPPPPPPSRRGRSPVVWVLVVLAALLVLWLLLVL